MYLYLICCHRQRLRILKFFFKNLFIRNRTPPGDMTINSLPSCRNHVSRHINISSCDQDKWNFLSAYNMCYTKLNSCSVDLFGPYMVRFTFTVSHSWCRVTLNLYCEGKKKCIKISLSIPLIPQVQSPEM